MSTPAVPDVRNIVGLRKRWPEWRIGQSDRHSKVKMNRYRMFASRDDIRIESDWEYKPSAAARALDALLVAAGYEPKPCP